MRVWFSVTTYYLGITISLFMAVLLAANAHASDDIKLNITATPDHLPPGSAFRLTVTVEGEGLENPPEPALPPLNDFEIVGQSTSRRVSMTGLSMSVSRSVTYQVLAQKEGTFEIPPIILEYKGKKYSSEPITITVDTNAPKPKGPTTARRRTPAFPDLGGLFDDDFFRAPQKMIDKNDLFVTMNVDKDNVVQYEQVIATFSFLRAVDIWNNPKYTRSKFEGFWVEDLPFENGQNERTSQKTINGKRYLVTQIRYALFPISTGPLLINPAELSVSFSPLSGPVTLTTLPVIVNVKPFPQEGKPDGFSGATLSGMNVSAKPDRDQVKVNESVTVRLTIKGKGYTKQAKPPIKPVIDGTETFDPQVNDTVEKTGGEIVSTRTIDYLMIPREEGNVVVEPFNIATYDTVKDEYIIAKTDPVKINVEGQAGSSDENVSARRTVTIKDQGPRYIKPDSKHLEQWGKPLHQSFWALIILVIPLLIMALAIFWSNKRSKLLTDIGYARSVSARKQAVARLNKAGATEDPVQFYTALDMAVRGYLADKWGINAPAVTTQEVSRRLSNSDNGLKTGFIELLSAVEHARYARAEYEDMKSYIRKANDLIDAMERREKS